MYRKCSQNFFHLIVGQAVWLTPSYISMAIPAMSEAMDYIKVGSEGGGNVTLITLLQKCVGLGKNLKHRV